MSQGNRIGGVRGFFRLIKQLKTPLRRRYGRLQHVQDIGGHRNRVRELTHILNNGLNIPDQQPATEDQCAAKHRRRNIADIVEQHDRRHHNAGEELRLPYVPAERLVEL